VPRLWELSKPTDAEFERGIEAERIHPEMERSDVAFLRGPVTRRASPIRDTAPNTAPSAMTSPMTADFQQSRTATLTS
jgi:hypothetical protein